MRTHLSMLLGIWMLPLLLKMCLLHVWWHTHLAHVIISHGGELCRIHIHVHRYSVGSYVTISHLLGHKLPLLKNSLLL